MEPLRNKRAYSDVESDDKSTPPVVVNLHQHFMTFTPGHALTTSKNDNASKKVKPTTPKEVSIIIERIVHTDSVKITNKSSGKILAVTSMVTILQRLMSCCKDMSFRNGAHLHISNPDISITSFLTKGNPLDCNDKIIVDDDFSNVPLEIFMQVGPLVALSKEFTTSNRNEAEWNDALTVVKGTLKTEFAKDRLNIMAYVQTLNLFARKNTEPLHVFVGLVIECMYEAIKPLDTDNKIPTIIQWVKNPLAVPAHQPWPIKTANAN